MQVKKQICSLGVFVKKHWVETLVHLIAILLIFFSGTIFAADELKGIMPTLKENFGSGSSAIKILYLFELLTALILASKTKEYMKIAGVLIPVLAATYGLDSFVFKGV